MTGDLDPWMELAGQLDEASKPRGSAEQSAAPKGQERATIVAGIARGLRSLVRAVRQSVVQEAAAAKRAELRGQLEEVRKHAQALLQLVDVPDEYGKAFVTPDTAAWTRVGHLQDALGGYDFDADGPGPLQELAGILHELSGRAAAALRAIPGGRQGGVRHIVRPDGLNAEELCALVIFEAWALLNPARPAGSHDDAPSLPVAAAYWQLCGLPQGTRTKAASWSTDFGRVKRLVEAPVAAGKEELDPLTRMRRAIRGVLTEGEAFWKADPEEHAAFTSLMDVMAKMEGMASEDATGGKAKDQPKQERTAKDGTKH